MELMLEFQKVHEQDTAAAQDPSPTVEATTGKPDTQVASKPKNARRYRKQKKKQDEKEETDERGKTSLITESHDSQDETENMQESAENDESRRWRSRWDIERPTTPEMRDNGWMVRRVVQARETQAQVRLAEEQTAAWVESRPSRSARDDFLRFPFSRSATGYDRQSFQRPPAPELDGTPSEPPTERMFPCVPPEYRSRLEESKPRSARPGIVNRSLTSTQVHESGMRQPQWYRDLAGVVRSSVNKSA